MSTNTQIIEDALGLLGIISESETASAEQAAHGLRRLNQMLALWEDVDKISLGYFAQTVASDDCPLPAWAEKGVAGHLALDLAPHYHATISAEGAKVIADGYEAILRNVFNANLPTANLSHLGGGNARYNIETDT